MMNVNVQCMGFNYKQTTTFRKRKYATKKHKTQGLKGEEAKTE